MPGDRPAASVLARYFGSSVETVSQYVDLLTNRAIGEGALGPAEASRVWERHILNCVVGVTLVPRDASVADVGSGAGLPGVVWAIARPDLSVTLIESLQRRTTFLSSVVADLRLHNVRVVHDRAEALVGRLEFDVVTARAVAPLSRLARWTVPLCRRTGEVLAFKGSAAVAELDEAEKTLQKLGVARARIQYVGHGVVEPPVCIVRLQSWHSMDVETFAEM